MKCCIIAVLWILVIKCNLYLCAQEINNNNPNLPDSILVKTFLTLGDSLYKAGLYDSSLYYYYKINIICEKKNDHKNYLISCVGIAKSHYFKAQYNLALIYYEKSLETIDKFFSSDSQRIAPIYNGIGNLQKKTGNYIKAK